MKWDGHTHTRFCRHGDDAELSTYIDRALQLGFECYSVTEHPPLPAGWVDNPVLMHELAMDEDELDSYFQYAWTYKRSYAEQIEIRVGLELDYLCGSESFSLDLVERSGARLQDAVVSVHFLPGKGGMRCLDVSPEDVRDGLLSYYGSMSKLIDEYFDHVERAIEFSSKLAIPKRLGHVLLIEKFHKVLPQIDDAQVAERLRRLIPLMRTAMIGLDVNTAGLRKETCGRMYVPAWFHHACLQAGIACVFGSDAHSPYDAGAGWDEFVKQAKTGPVAKVES